MGEGSRDGGGGGGGDDVMGLPGLALKNTGCSVQFKF